MSSPPAYVGLRIDTVKSALSRLLSAPMLRNTRMNRSSPKKRNNSERFLQDGLQENATGHNIRMPVNNGDSIVDYVFVVVQKKYQEILVRNSPWGRRLPAGSGRERAPCCPHQSRPPGQGQSGCSWTRKQSSLDNPSNLRNPSLDNEKMIVMKKLSSADPRTHCICSISAQIDIKNIPRH